MGASWNRGYTLPDLRYTYPRKTHTRQTFLEIGERPDSNIHSWSICQWADKPLCIDGKGSFQVRVSYFPILSNIAYQRTDYVSNPIYLSIQISIIHLYSYQAIYLQGAPKKCPIANFSLNLFHRSDYTFSHVLRNQNFESVPSKHFKHTHSEYKAP